MKDSKIFRLLILVSLADCSLTDAEIKEHSWKYAEGYNIGDWVDFNNSIFILTNDTIYSNGEATAKIIYSRINVFASKRSITIESIFKKEKGIYIKK